MTLSPCSVRLFSIPALTRWFLLSHDSTQTQFVVRANGMNWTRAVPAPPATSQASVRENTSARGIRVRWLRGARRTDLPGISLSDSERQEWCSSCWHSRSRWAHQKKLYVKYFLFSSFQSCGRRPPLSYRAPPCCLTKTLSLGLVYKAAFSNSISLSAAETSRSWWSVPTPDQTTIVMYHDYKQKYTNTEICIQ